MNNKRSTGFCTEILAAGAVAIIGLGIYRASRENIEQLQLEKARTEKGYILQVRDLNGNGLPERFFEVDGKKYFLAVDGTNLTDTLKR